MGHFIKLGVVAGAGGSQPGLRQKVVRCQLSEQEVPANLQNPLAFFLLPFTYLCKDKVVAECAFLTHGGGIQGMNVNREVLSTPAEALFLLLLPLVLPL